MTKEKNRFKNEVLHRINPYVRYAKYDVLEPRRTIHERTLYDYELIYIKSGKATVTVDDERFEAQAGDFFFLKPGHRNCILVHDEPLIQPHIHFDLVYQQDRSLITPISHTLYQDMEDEQKSLIQQDISDAFFPSFPSRFTIKNSLYMEQLLYDVISAYQSPALFPEIHTCCCFLRMWDHLLSEIFWQHSEHVDLRQERADHIKLFLEHNVNQKITLDDLARNFHIDKSYISRVFQAAFHVSPIRYHLHLRITKSKEMLRYTNISVGSIAEQLGFSSQQDFSRAFQRMEGITPTDFRKKS